MNDYVSVSKGTFEDFIKNYPIRILGRSIDYFGDRYHVYLGLYEEGSNLSILGGDLYIIAKKKLSEENYFINKAALNRYLSTDISALIRCSSCKYFLNGQCLNENYIIMWPYLTDISAGKLYVNPENFCIYGEKISSFTTSRHVCKEKVLKIFGEKLIYAVGNGSKVLGPKSEDEEKEFFERILSDTKTEEILTTRDIYIELNRILLDEYNEIQKRKEVLKAYREEELKPCPFCGGKAEFMVHIDDSPGRRELGAYLCSVGVRCSNCTLARFQPANIHVPVDSLYATIEELRDDSIKFWNQRA